MEQCELCGCVVLTSEMESVGMPLDPLIQKKVNALVKGCREDDVEGVREKIKMGVRTYVDESAKHNRPASDEASACRIACYNTTPLRAACAASSFKIVALLVERGSADVNARDVNGNTPLAAAAAADSSYIIVEYLIAKGADVNLKDAVGQTALYDMGSVKVANALLEAGADVDTLDIDGMTPLINYCASVASINKWGINKRVPKGWYVEFMVSVGADLGIKDKAGMDALDYTFKNQYWKDAWAILTNGTLSKDYLDQLLPKARAAKASKELIDLIASNASQ